MSAAARGSPLRSATALVLVAAMLGAPCAAAEPIAVRFVEGVSHGFLTLRTVDAAQIAEVRCLEGVVAVETVGDAVADRGAAVAGRERRGRGQRSSRDGKNNKLRVHLHYSSITRPLARSNGDRQHDNRSEMKRAISGAGSVIVRGSATG